ncbi:hypothetical protein ZYGM_000030, partial [Zygosaccharomyces mellis]
VTPLIKKENIYVVTNKEYKDKIKVELGNIDPNNIFTEPQNKETATCIGLSAVKLLKRDGDAVMVVLPSDHHIENEKMGPRIQSSEIPTYKVARFTEKPNVEVAKDFLLKGTYLWNSGMFVFRADVILREIEKYLPQLYKSLMEIYKHIGEDDEEEVINEQYSLIDGISIDFGVMQKTRKAFVIKSDFIWDDIGSFSALSRYLEEKKDNKTSNN